MSSTCLAGFDGFELGTMIGDGVERLFEEAIAACPGERREVERAYAGGLMQRARSGDLGAYTLMARGDVAGVIFYRAIENEADLVYGYVRASLRGAEEHFLNNVISALSMTGVNIIRSGFSWPVPEGFIGAALRKGFAMVERKSMAYDVKPYPVMEISLPEGIRIVPWRNDLIYKVCMVMCEEAAPVDKLVYPLFSTYRGSLSLMTGILDDKHGIFLPDLSMVAKDGDRVAGFLISSLMVDGSVLILDIAVSKGYRHKGIATAMIGILINKAACLGKQQIVLAVTSLNTNAVKLYHKLGFRETSKFRQYVWTGETA